MSRCFELIGSSIHVISGHVQTKLYNGAKYYTENKNVRPSFTFVTLYRLVRYSLKRAAVAAELKFRTHDVASQKEIVLGQFFKSLSTRRKPMQLHPLQLKRSRNWSCLTAPSASDNAPSEFNQSKQPVTLTW